MNGTIKKGQRLSPRDVQQHEFSAGWRGYDKREVDAFMELVGQTLADVLRDGDLMQQELLQLRRELDAHREREETLREAMLTAQRAIDEIREQAKKEAQVIVTDAELRAEKLLHNAQSRVTKLLDETIDLKRQRLRAVEELRSLLNSHTRMLDACEEEVPDEATVTVLGPVRAPQPPAKEQRTIA